MQLGAFSISLAVEDMAVSRAFYEKLGFAMIGGDGETWTIVANETTAIGLFHGMFDANMLTFNPGWQGLGEPAEAFTDVRELSTQLRAAGIEPSDDTTADTPNGPASFTVTTGFARMLRYQSATGPLPEIRYIAASITPNQISISCGFPDTRPVVTMSQHSTSA